MVRAVGDARVVDTLEARLEDARRRHEANEYGPKLLLEVIEAGICSVWAEEHPARLASPRPVNNERGVDVGVNAGGDQVSNNAGGTSRQRGVIHVDEVGGVQARVMRSSASTSSSQGDVGGRQSSLSPMSATHVTAGGIASSYGYSKFMPDKISVTPLLVGRPDILTWKEAIKPQLEMAGLIGFARGNVATPEAHYPDLRAEEYFDAGHRAWHFIKSTYQVTDALYISQLEEQLSHLRMGEEETATGYCNRARRILATMRMAGVHYWTALYLMHYVAPVKQGGQPGQRRQSGGGGSSGWKPTKDAERKKSAKDSSGGGGSRRRECWLCGDPNDLSFECPDRSDSDDDDAKGGRGRSGSRRPHRGRNYPRKEKQSTKSSTLAKDADSSAGGKGRDNKEALCSLVGVVEPTVSMAPEAGEDFQAMASAVQANPAVVLLDSGCSHHLMGTKEVFIDLEPSGGVKHVRDFNGALQNIHGCGNVALQGEAGRQVLIPNVLYVPGVRANLLSAGQLKENGMKLQKDGDGMLLISAAGDSSFGRPTLGKFSPPTYVTARRSRERPQRRSWPCGRLSCSAKHEVATGFYIKSASGADMPCVLCVGGKLVQHTFPDQGSDADDVLAVRHVKKSVLMLHSDRGGEFLRKQFTEFVNGKGIVHDLTCPYTLQQNDMAEREMRTVVESVRTMLLDMGVQHHWWHLALRQAVWVCNCLERSTLQPGATPYQLLTGKKPDLSLALVWGCMAQFLVPEQQRGGKLKPKARLGLHLGVSEESKGWKLLDIADNRVVTTSDVVFYEKMLLEVWKSEHGPALGRTPTILPTDTLTETLSLLAEVGELAAEDVEDVPSPFPSPFPHAPPLVADLRGLTPASASGDEGRSEALPVAPTKSIAGTRQQLIGEQAAAKSTKKQSATRQTAEEPTTGEKSAGKPAKVQQDDEGSEAGDDGGDAEESTDSDVVEDILTMTVKEALASWKGRAVKAAMEEEIRSLVSMGMWELVERPPGVNIMKNGWVLTTEYHIDDTVERQKARLVVKGFTQVYGADYDETYAPVSSYVTLRIFLSIVVVLELNLM
ncbi:unnamed protein product [Closterium sp. NIES-53]